MSYRRPAFLVRNNNTSSYFFRSVIPLDLRPKFNNVREFRVSLRTGILSEAQLISSQLKFEADTIFHAIRCGNISGTCVSSIKEQLRNLRDRLLLIKMRGGGSEIENPGPAKINGTPSELFRKMELSKEDLLRMRKEKEELEEARHMKSALKLLRSYFHRFSYEDVRNYCEAIGLDFTEEMFPRGYVRKCRQSIISQLEEYDGVMEAAEEIALEVIEAHIDSLSRKEFVEFFSRFKLLDSELESVEKKEDLLNMMESYDTVAIALEIGVDIAFAANSEEEEEETPAEERPRKTPDEILGESWKKLYTPPPSKSTTKETSPAIESQPENSTAEKKSPRISEMAKAYFEETKMARRCSDKTLMEQKSGIDRLIEIVGDVRADGLSYEIAREYKQTLMRLPPNMKKDPLYRNLSIEEILLLDDVKPIAPNTVNKNLKVIIAFMNWAMKHGYLDRNYFEGLKLPKVKKAQDERKPFSEEDIRTIFNPTTYLKDAGDKPSRYWVPLLAAFTGARLNELCQLHVEDIKQKEGIWCISINDASEDADNPKKLKNKASKRLIPVHNELITLGFIDFVNQQRQSNHVRLFPELKHDANGFSKLTSKWFNEVYLRKTLGINDKRKTFHSFRHTVANTLKQQGVMESYISELLGHSSGKSETFGRYGDSYRPKALMEETVSKIRYEGLEL